MKFTNNAKLANGYLASFQWRTRGLFWSHRKHRNAVVVVDDLSLARALHSHPENQTCPAAATYRAREWSNDALERDTALSFGKAGCCAVGQGADDVLGAGTR